MTDKLEWDGFATGTPRFEKGSGVNQSPPESVDDLADPFKQAEFLFKHEGDQVQLSRLDYYRIIRGLYDRCQQLEDSFERMETTIMPGVNRRTQRGY